MLSLTSMTLMSPPLLPLPKRSHTFPNSLPDTSPRTPEHHWSPSSVTMAFLARSVLSLRRNQVASTDQHHEESDLQDLELFQTFVADRLLSLLSPPSPPAGKPDAAGTHDPLVSFSFLQRLLDVFVSCGDEFKNLLARNPGLAAKPPVDRLLSDLLDRAVKSLDVCNAVRHHLQSLRQWNRNADIAASAVPARAEPPRGECHLKRTKKALASLLANQIQGPSAASRKPDRAWSLRCKASSASAREENSNSNPNSQPPSKNWSALKEVQAMSSSLAAPPRTGDPGGGLAAAVYTMSSVLVFAMWALVAAFPWQERGASLASTPVVPPKQMAWAAAMSVLQERIAEEWRRRGRREGILVELLGVEKCGKELMDSAASWGGGGMEVVVRKAAELARASRRLEKGLGPFDRHVREVFHRVAESRAEVMRFLEQSTKSAPPFIVL